MAPHSRALRSMGPSTMSLSGMTACSLRKVNVGSCVTPMIRSVSDRIGTVIAPALKATLAARAMSSQSLAMIFGHREDRAVACDADRALQRPHAAPVAVNDPAQHAADGSASRCTPRGNRSTSLSVLRSARRTVPSFGDQARPGPGNGLGRCAAQQGFGLELGLELARRGRRSHRCAASHAACSSAVNSRCSASAVLASFSMRSSRSPRLAFKASLSRMTFPFRTLDNVRAVHD